MRAGHGSAARVRVLAVLLCVVTLAACSGDLTLPLAGEGGQAGATRSTSPDQPFNPFVEVSETSVTARTVIKDPTVEQIMKVGTLPDFSIGRADAPVVMIKYMSLTCPYCRRFQAETFPVLKREYIDTGKVRFIIREFPIGKSSGTATIALRCAPMDKYLTLYGKFLAQQGQWVSQEVNIDAIYRVAAQVGISRAQFDTCRQNQAMIDGLKWIKDRGRELGVIGTPNFFIGGRLVKKVVGMQEIRDMIDPLVAGRVAAKAAPASN